MWKILRKFVNFEIPVGVTYGSVIALINSMVAYFHAGLYTAFVVFFLTFILGLIIGLRISHDARITGLIFGLAYNLVLSMALLSAEDGMVLGFTTILFGSFSLFVVYVLTECSNAYASQTR